MRLLGRGGRGRSDFNQRFRVDLVIDPSVRGGFFMAVTALEANMTQEFVRNNERYEFLKWAENHLIIIELFPPATGIIHQVNIEFLSDVIIEKDGQQLYPDSMFGTGQSLRP